MTLLELARSYLACRIVSPDHAADVYSVCRRAQMSQTNGSINPAELIAWLRSQVGKKTPATIARYRRILQSVVAWGAQHGLCTPIVLPRIKVPAPLPEAWTLAQVSRILTTASQWPGQVGKIAAKDWWPALILVVYWTGVRIGSLLAATPSDWDGEYLIIRKTKTGKPAAFRLHRQANEAIRRIYDPKADRLFAWPHTRWYLFRQFRRIVETAGVPAPKYSRSLFHRLRRTCISYCWARNPAIAQRQADHSSAEVTRRHYVDPRIVAEAETAADVLPVPEYRPGPVQLRLFPETKTA
jgi:integrase